MSTDVQRLSYQRDIIYDYCCERFKELMAEDRHEDALAIADEFFEWLDPEQLEEEETMYSMKKNSSNSTPNDFPITDEMRDLIVRYMEACNAGDNAEADVLLHQIKHESSNSITTDSD